jgi:uncharacterized membrane protein
MSNEVAPSAPGGMSPHRIEALGDGVFSIAMTLLVLEIHVPQMPAGTSESELLGGLLALWPKVLSYAASFVVIGIYWIGHRTQYHYIRRADRTFLWINILFMMFIAFIPFSAALLGNYSGYRTAVIVYGCNLIAAGLALLLHWWYATSGRRLVDHDLDEAFVRVVNTRILVAPCIYLGAIALSFISTRASLVVCALVLLYYILPGQVDRHFRFRPSGEIKQPRDKQ